MQRRKRSRIIRAWARQSTVRDRESLAAFAIRAAFRGKPS
ncbi:hypothetical protein PCLA_15r0101 [Pseudomonas citronellolis]|nr:hypothetical protein PCLA_15r0101 [Pseudomonas citronellolis]